jgi:hypothetical protein
MVTTITLSTEEGSVTISRETQIFWPEVLAVFMDVLRGAGYKPGAFYYDNAGTVLRGQDLSGTEENEILD